MSVVFVSFDGMGWACLDKIIAIGGNVVAIVTLEDQLLEKRSKFQGFEDIAGKAQAPLLKCKKINQLEIIDALAKLHPDIIFIIDRCTAPVRLGSGPERTPSAVYRGDKGLCGTVGHADRLRICRALLPDSRDSRHWRKLDFRKV